MKKTGRNEPCPCGSGKKYKKCCLNSSKPSTGGTPFYSDLDKLSNQAPDLIRQKKFDQAEGVCRKLLEQFPDQIDGLHRYAELFEAQGKNQEAAEYYRKTVEFAERAEGFEKESVAFFREKAEHLADTEKN
jgi:tetratricopeptide (TPR) repeat protein